jgi:hypothetical protein
MILSTAITASSFRDQPMTADHYPHPAAMDEQLLLQQCTMRRQRRSGPGGQHRNKVETAVILTHVPTGVQAEATERRSQAENRQVAARRLRIRLAVQVRSTAVEDSPSPLWQSRVSGGRIAVNPKHADFPAMLAEALDALAGSDWDVSQAATHLGCTGSQLVKFVRLEPSAFALLRQEREQRGLRPLR